jgi:dCMP deaminase
MGDRITRDELYAGVARLVAQRSTCARSQVGVLIVKDSRILMTGYNGTPAGMAHCNHTCRCYPPGRYPDPRFHDEGCPEVSPCTLAIHGEANAIAHAAREGICIDGAMLFTTLSPCVACAQLIIAAGIEEVTYLEAYRDPAGASLLMDAGVAVGSL